MSTFNQFFGVGSLTSAIKTIQNKSVELQGMVDLVKTITITAVDKDKAVINITGHSIVAAAPSREFLTTVEFDGLSDNNWTQITVRRKSAGSSENYGVTVTFQVIEYY